MMTNPCTPETTSEQLHIARSKCIDAFADVELAVVGLLIRAGAKPGAESLGQKMELLRKSKPAPQYSKEKRATTLGLLDELESLTKDRNDIVHGKLAIANIEDNIFACFINAVSNSACTNSARLVNLAQFAKLNRQVNLLAQVLAKP